MDDFKDSDEGTFQPHQRSPGSRRYCLFWLIVTPQPPVVQKDHHLISRLLFTPDIHCRALYYLLDGSFFLTYNRNRITLNLIDSGLLVLLVLGDCKLGRWHRHVVRVCCGRKSQKLQIFELCCLFRNTPWYNDDTGVIVSYPCCVCSCLKSPSESSATFELARISSSPHHLHHMIK